MIGDTPVTVTHCDLTECTRVLTDATAPSPLGIGVWGWKNGDMQLLINGQRIPHRSRRLPLEELPHVVVPWEDWRYLYPDTDVYTRG
jgi:hypothetical protein